MSQTPQLGYDQELFILPFDHRGTFSNKMLGVTGRTLTAAETQQIVVFKEIIYEGYQKALKLGVNPKKSGILVDEQYGENILIDARAKGFQTALTGEKSGQDEFDFEYGSDFANHIEKFKPTFVKVLVRFNPENDRALNARQALRLKELSDYCLHRETKLLLELLVPATPAQLEHCEGSVANFDRNLRPALMVEGIRFLQDQGIEADLWKVEGSETQADSEKIALQARSGGAHRAKVGVILLGRGENSEKVKHWLRTAAPIDGIVGFAVGRTVFWDSLVAFKSEKIDRDTASNQIAATFKSFCELWISSKHHERKL